MPTPTRMNGSETPLQTAAIKFDGVLEGTIVGSKHRDPVLKHAKVIRAWYEATSNRFIFQPTTLRELRAEKSKWIEWNHQMMSEEGA